MVTELHKWCYLQWYKLILKSFKIYLKPHAVLVDLDQQEKSRKNMDLAVKYQKATGPADAYQRVKEAITPETIAKFKVKADLSYKENEQIAASGKGFDLFFDFT